MLSNGKFILDGPTGSGFRARGTRRNAELIFPVVTTQASPWP